MPASALYWPVPLPPEPALGPVRAWLADLAAIPGEPEALAAALTPAERARAGAFHLARDRDRFIRRRWLRLRVLADAGGVALEEVRVEHDALGRPRISAPGALAGLDLSTSSAGDLAAVALSWGPRVGIDIAAIDPGLAGAAAAEVFMSPAELAWWRAGPAAERPARFFQLWTRKEAALKALGTGLQRDPRTLSFHDDARPREGRLGDHPPAAHDIAPGRGLAGAVAVLG